MLHPLSLSLLQDEMWSDEDLVSDWFYKRETHSEGENTTLTQDYFRRGMQQKLCNSLSVHQPPKVCMRPHNLCSPRRAPTAFSPGTDTFHTCPFAGCVLQGASVSWVRQASYQGRIREGHPDDAPVPAQRSARHGVFADLGFPQGGPLGRHWGILDPKAEVRVQNRG